MHTRSLIPTILVVLLVTWSLQGCEGQQPPHREAPPAAERAETPGEEAAPEPAEEPTAAHEELQEPSEEETLAEPEPEAEPQPTTGTDPAPAPQQQEAVSPAPEPKPAPAPKPQASAKPSPAAPLTPPDPMVLSAPEGVAMKQAPVSFSHKRHSAQECTACHHMWDGKGAIGGCMDPGCHDLADARTPQEKKDPTWFYNAFHARGSLISCVGCHGEMRKAGQATGPIGCQECHKRE